MTKKDIQNQLSACTVELIDLSANLHDRPASLVLTHLSAIIRILQEQHTHLIELVNKEAQ